MTLFLRALCDLNKLKLWTTLLYMFLKSVSPAIVFPLSICKWNVIIDLLRGKLPIFKKGRKLHITTGLSPLQVFVVKL